MIVAARSEQHADASRQFQIPVARQQPRVTDGGTNADKLTLVSVTLPFDVVFTASNIDTPECSCKCWSLCGTFAYPSTQFGTNEPYLVGILVSFSLRRVIGYSQQAVGVASLLGVAVEQPPREPVFNHHTPFAVFAERNLDFDVGGHDGIEEQIGLQCEERFVGLERLRHRSHVYRLSLWQTIDAVVDAGNPVVHRLLVIDVVVAVTQIGHPVDQDVIVVVRIGHLYASQFRVGVFRRCVDDVENLLTVGQERLSDIASQTFPVFGFVLCLYQFVVNAIFLDEVAGKPLASALGKTHIFLVRSFR